MCSSGAILVFTQVEFLNNAGGLSKSFTSETNLSGIVRNRNTPARGHCNKISKQQVQQTKFTEPEVPIMLFSFSLPRTIIRYYGIVRKRNIGTDDEQS